MKKRWLIEKKCRRCGDSRCQGYEKTNHEVVVHEDGVVETTCRDCGKVSTRQSYSYKESRPCEKCGWVRDVVVNVSVSGDGKEWAKKNCSVCEMEISARRHLAAYTDFMDRVRKARAERNRRAGRTEFGM